ncbi:MAG: response regulator transcription factor [Saprospiraceae bacterium]|nr:response regulator transcription factor [Saprospiraceae bacterium]MBK9044973.1 response regulator transcription factor [Saprospiraceae bacterium]
MSVRILIVEDEPIISDDIESTLLVNDYDIAGKAYSSTQALDMLINRSPDIVLLDISIKGDKDGIDIAAIIREKYHLPFIFLTSFSDKITLERAIPTMPYGYIVKPFKDRDIITSIELAMFRFASENNTTSLDKTSIENKFAINLTKMEFQILMMIWEGKSNQAAAKELFLSVNTVKTHVRNLFEKCNVRNRNELMVMLR